MEKRGAQTARELDDPYVCKMVLLVTARLRRLNPRPRTTPLALAILSQSVLEYLSGRKDNAKILAITALSVADPGINRDMLRACRDIGSNLLAEVLAPELKRHPRPDKN